MARKYFIVFNKLNSLDLGLKVIKRPNFPLPKRRYETFDIQDGDGQLVEDLGTFEDVKVDVEFNFIDRDNIHIKVTKILNWLNKVNDYDLYFADDLERHYKVKMVEYSDIERQLKVKGIFTISFICEPYKYYNQNSLISITTNNASFYSINELVYNAKPILKIYGSGDITLTINNEDVLLKSISNHIILNSTLMEAYNDNVDNLNNKMNGYFPILKSGLNTISWIGSVTKIEITPNWRSL
ncbi:distal tail protein Dit [Clostridium intestinale]|uniref:distal tail protein Dit n=1 Tax=Clostridium intestinale TaxID=36845 RepID=UPI0028E8376C|nr:distal tail protein Dit [Clostridium intestinale]